MFTQGESLNMTACWIIDLTRLRLVDFPLFFFLYLRMSLFLLLDKLISPTLVSTNFAARDTFFFFSTKFEQPRNCMLIRCGGVSANKRSFNFDRTFEIQFITNFFRPVIIEWQNKKSGGQIQFFFFGWAERKDVDGVSRIICAGRRLLREVIARDTFFLLGPSGHSFFFLRDTALFDEKLIIGLDYCERMILKLLTRLSQFQPQSRLISFSIISVILKSP